MIKKFHILEDLLMALSVPLIILLSSYLRFYNHRPVQANLFPMIDNRTERNKVLRFVIKSGKSQYSKKKYKSVLVKVIRKYLNVGL